MSAHSFVSNWLQLKEELLATFTDDAGVAEVARQIREMNLSAEQQAQMREVVNAILRDTMYTLLLGLDGAASIGRSQQIYTIKNEQGAIIAPDGDLEAEAWRQFQS
jgi:hypothetical protein